MKQAFTGLLTLALGLCVVNTSPVENKRLIKTSEDDPGVWKTLTEIIQLKINRQSFVDITNDRDFHLTNVHPAKNSAIPSNPRYQSLVNSFINSANQTRVESFLKEFSDFWNRYYDSEDGVASEQWLTSQVQASLNGYNGNSSVREVGHTWRQKSIIARLDGTDTQLQSEVVILGAHQDSINGADSNGIAPGADDNGSGSAVVLETLRILVSAGFQPKRTIEFHWYAAEDEGLLGSAEVAKEYRENEVNVVAMLNLDAVGYQPSDINYIGIYTDYTDDEITQLLRVLTDEYLSFGREDLMCGYGCSDHASWTRNDYKAGLAAEVAWNPNMHTEDDVYDSVSFTQIMEFVKLAIGFVTEVAEPITTSTNVIQNDKVSKK